MNLLFIILMIVLDTTALLTREVSIDYTASEVRFGSM